MSEQDLHVSEVFGFFFSNLLLMHSSVLTPAVSGMCTYVLVVYFLFNVCCNQKVLDLKTQTFEVNNPVCPRSVLFGVQAEKPGWLRLNLCQDVLFAFGQLQSRRQWHRMGAQWQQQQQPYSQQQDNLITSWQQQKSGFMFSLPQGCPFLNKEINVCVRVFAIHYVSVSF